MVQVTVAHLENRGRCQILGGDILLLLLLVLLDLDLLGFFLGLYWYVVGLPEKLLDLFLEDSRDAEPLHTLVFWSPPHLGTVREFDTLSAAPR